MDLINPTPVVHERRALVKREAQANGHPSSREPIDALEIFEHIRDITDPEHPYTLEQLNVVAEDHIAVCDRGGTVRRVGSKSHFQLEHHCQTPQKHLSLMFKLSQENLSEKF